MTDIIFGLDPGSLRSGWAVLDRSERLLQGGILTATRFDAELRIQRMCWDLLELLDEIQPAIIVIETTTGKVGRKRHKGLGAGLAIYGMSIGALWQTAEAWLRSLSTAKRIRVEIVLIKENTWCRGVSKAARIDIIEVAYPEYRKADDPGGNLADAIGIVVWYLREHRVRLCE